MFLEKRVYQGSSGKVYPLPFTDRIAEKPVAANGRPSGLRMSFSACWCCRRSAAASTPSRTRPTATTDLQPAVIKPRSSASPGRGFRGGIEFNWPQHHRPATFLPVDHEIEKHADGSA
jgi:hypothetical protein